MSREEADASPAAGTRESAGANRGQADGDGDWRGSASGPTARPADAAPAEEETTWRGSARGAGSRGDWSRDSCGPTSRPALELAPRSAPVERDAPVRDFGSMRGGGGPTSRDEAPSRFGGGPSSRDDAPRSRFGAPMGPRACMFFARGQCQRGDACNFSHDEAVIDALKNEQEENRKKQLEANPEQAAEDGAAPTRKPLQLSKPAGGRMPLKLAQRSAPSSPVGTPTKRAGNDISAAAPSCGDCGNCADCCGPKTGAPAPVAERQLVDDDGFEVVTVRNTSSKPPAQLEHQGCF